LANRNFKPRNAGQPLPDRIDAFGGGQRAIGTRHKLHGNYGLIEATCTTGIDR
jgi:hypothetical protein